jgi:AGZA family xanthine/uracil permease-like MFS transporter
VAHLRIDWSLASDGQGERRIELTGLQGPSTLTSRFDRKTDAVLCQVSRTRYTWAAPGDINAFFGLMLDNVAGLLLMVGLLDSVFGFPTQFSLRWMVPGTAIGVLVGDVLFFLLALQLARQTGRSDVTAMPLGLDTPSTIGMVFFVLGPAFLAARRTMTIEQAALHTWHIGICSILLSGLFKLACAFVAHRIRMAVPRAGLLGSLAAIALVLISFLPLLEVLHYPLVGLVSLAIVFTSLVARVPLPGRVPGALGALLVGSCIYYLMKAVGLLHAADSGIVPREALLPTEWWAAFGGGWMHAFGDSLTYLPVVIPFALATVVGGIDCTESAAAAGDEFATSQVIGVEALATMVAALCGGVIQTTPYIGHPAYKAMGGRAAYTLATALFVGSAGLIGFFGYMYWIVPKATVFPILVFIGLEITAQSFQATPTRHYAAVALACVPALAALTWLYVDKLLGEARAHGLTLQQLSAPLQLELQTVRVLANGFILTSLLWASALASIIDRRLSRSAIFFLIAAGCSLFGIIHSPLDGAAMFQPWNLNGDVRHTPLGFAAGYLATALLLVGWHAWHRHYGAPAPNVEESA